MNSDEAEIDGSPIDIGVLVGLVLSILVSGIV